MTGTSLSIVSAMTLVALFSFAGQAFADAGAMEAAVSMPAVRVFLGLASIAFTAALARATVR